VSKKPDYIKTIDKLASVSEDTEETEYFSGFEYSGDAKIDVPLTFEELLAQIPKGKMDKDLYEGYLKDMHKLRAVAEQRIADVAEVEKKQKAKGTKKQAAEGTKKRAAEGAKKQTAEGKQKRRRK
jgi:hypothetical protein